MSSADPGLLVALGDLERALAAAGIKHMVIGGLAVIARGVPRQTADVDATVWGEGIDPQSLLKTLAAHQLVGRIPDALAFAREHQVFLLRHEPTGTPLEVTLASLPFELEALRRAESMDLGGVRVPVVLAEDLIVYKAVAWRDRDRADVERLLVLHGRSIDLTRVRSLVRDFAEALEEPERVRQFEDLLRRALGP